MPPCPLAPTQVFDMAYRIPDDVLDHIRSSVDIVEVVSEYVPLKKRGRNFVGLCPFHTEKTPSFNVNPELQIYRCFGCQAGGNVFRFLMEVEQVSFVEAVRSVAQRAGIELPSGAPDGEVTETHDDLYAANELAQRYFAHLLQKDPRGEEARAYLRSRRLSEETIERFGIGYALEDWDDLIAVARRRKLSEGTLERAGLALPRKTGGYYDRFRNRVMFPILNVSGRTVGFGARALAPDQEPKYLNSPETPIYHKGSTLYGLHVARQAIRREGRTILVEGYTDLLRLSQGGIENAVATSGTALTEEHARVLRRYAGQAVIVYDADQAGSSASVRGIDVLLTADLDARIVSLPEGHDPDSFVLEQGPAAFLALLDRSQPVLEYKLKTLEASSDLTTVDGKAAAISSLAETVSKVRNEVKRSLLVREISERFGVDERTVVRAMRPRTRPTQTSHTEKAGGEHRSVPLWERELLGMMINRYEIARKVWEVAAPTDFSAGPCRQLAEQIVALCERERAMNPALLIDEVEDPGLAAFISEAALAWVEDADDERSLEDYLRRLRWNAIDRRILEVRAQARNVTDPDELMALTEELHKLNMQKRALGEIQRNR